MKPTHFGYSIGYPIVDLAGTEQHTKRPDIKTINLRSIRPPILMVIGLIALFIGISGNAFATEPTSPINIITPEDSAKEGKFTTDNVQVLINQKEINGFKLMLILFQNGKRLERLAIDLRAEPIKNPNPESQQELSLAKMEAVPDTFWKRVEPGIYAHKIRIEANIRGESASLIDEEWVRWRTDGTKLELLNIQQYSDLIEKRQKATDENGKPIEVLIGKDIKTELIAKPVIEKRGTQIGSEGVLLEREVGLSKQELKESQDERDED